MTEKDLEIIRKWLIDNIFRDYTIMYNNNIRITINDNNILIDLTDVIASLYNMLHTEITGEKYDYMFHWANKIGAYTDENFLHTIIRREKSNGEKEK